jgi:hypothetical protein
VTRLVLCAVLCGSTIVLALVSTAVQSRNRERGIALDSLKRECDMLEAINGDRCERILAIDWRRLPNDPNPRPVVVERRPAQ